MIRAYNTLSGEKEQLPDGTLHLFVCGPTVYDFSHIGHARTYLSFDIIARYLRAQGRSLTYIQNITDVDDKIIARARERGISPLALARRFAKAYFEDMRALRITSVDRYAFASRYIPEIVKQVQLLRQKGFAYEIPGEGLYFNIAKFPDYGKLSHRTAGEAEDSVSRIDESVKKRNRGDFCLWKYPKTPVKASRCRRFLVTREGEPVWNTKLGWGRPGWHIEDTAISVRHFGEQYELHGGATDLKFPHHEAEIAQAEAAYGKKPFVKIWLHTGFLTAHGEKMSKSAGNYVTIRDFLARHGAAALRILVLMHHYRSRFDYDESAAVQAEETLASVRLFVSKLAFLERKASAKDAGVETRIAAARREFDEALDDDFHTPRALAALLTLIRDIQGTVWELGRGDARALRRFVTDAFGMLGLQLEPVYAPRGARRKAEKRETFRRNQQFMRSDALREKIRALGYEVEDTPLGPFVYAQYNYTDTLREKNR